MTPTSYILVALLVAASGGCMTPSCCNDGQSQCSGEIRALVECIALPYHGDCFHIPKKVPFCQFGNFSRNQEYVELRGDRYRIAIENRPLIITNNTF